MKATKKPKPKPKNLCKCGGKLYFSVTTTRERSMKPDGTEGEWEDGGEEDRSICCVDCGYVTEL